MDRTIEDPGMDDVEVFSSSYPNIDPYASLGELLEDGESVTISRSGMWYEARMRNARGTSTTLSGAIEGLGVSVQHAGEL